MRRQPILAIACALAALSAGSAEKDPAKGASPAAGPPRYHRDAPALEQATLAVSKAILRGDTVTAHAELDRMAQLAPALLPDQRDVYGSDLLSGDGSLQITLKNAREYAATGVVDELFNEFVWVQRTCLHCHAFPGVAPKP